MARRLVSDASASCGGSATSELPTLGLDPIAEALLNQSVVLLDNVRDMSDEVLLANLKLDQIGLNNTHALLLLVFILHLCLGLAFLPLS